MCGLGHRAATDDIFVTAVDCTDRRVFENVFYHLIFQYRHLDLRQLSLVTIVPIDHLLGLHVGAGDIFDTLTYPGRIGLQPMRIDQFVDDEPDFHPALGLATEQIVR